MLEDDIAASSFSGVARLFPLPNLVFFPNVDQGLHIFEPRYRQLTADTLEDDNLIALVLLQPSTTIAPNMHLLLPPVAQYACLGRVVTSDELPDGTYNLRLRGLQRLRILEELPAEGKLYRRVQGQLVGDITPSDVASIMQLRAELREALLPRFDPTGQAYRQLEELMDSETPLGELCNMLGYALPLPMELKQQMLEEPKVLIRAQILTHALRPRERKNRPFPPIFSAN
jgi:uncharacterized protein